MSKYRFPEAFVNRSRHSLSSHQLLHFNTMASSLTPSPKLFTRELATYIIAELDQYLKASRESVIPEYCYLYSY